MNWKALAYIGVISLIFLDSFFINIPIGPLRMTLLRIVILTIFTIMFYRLILRKDKLDISNIKFPLVFLGLWFFYGVISIVWATDKITGIKELYYFFLFLILILILIYLLQNLNSSLITTSFWISGVIIVFICLVEFVLDIHLPTSRYVIEANRFSELSLKRATAFFYNENDLGLFLVLIFPVFLTGLLKKPIFLKCVNFIALFLIIIVNYINDSRLSIIALIIQIFIFTLLVNKNLIIRGMRILLLFSPLLLVIGALVVIPSLQNASFFDGIKAGSGSGFIRMNLYLNSLYATFHSFMLGVGPGNFQYNIYPMFDTLGIVNPHNWWLEILTNYGLLVFVGYCYFFFFIVSNLYSIYQLDKNNNHLALTLLLSFSGFSLACLGPSSVFYFWPMWLLYGVSLAYIVQNKV